MQILLRFELLINLALLRYVPLHSQGVSWASHRAGFAVNFSPSACSAVVSCPWDLGRAVCTCCARCRTLGRRKAVAACVSDASLPRLPSPCACASRGGWRDECLCGVRSSSCLPAWAACLWCLCNGFSGKVSDQSGWGLGTKGRETRGEELLYIYAYYTIKYYS